MQGQEVVGVGGDEQAARRARAHPDEGELPEAELSAPAGEDHERDPDDGVDRREGHEDVLRVVEQLRHDQDDEGQQHGAHGQGGPHLRKVAHHLGQPPHFLDGHKAAQFRAADPAGPAALEQEGHQDDDEDAHVFGVARRVVPRDRLLEGAESDAGHQGHRQALEAGDDRGGQREHKLLRRRDGGDIEALNAGGEDGAEAGQTGRDGPRDEREPSHRYPEEGRPVL